MKSTATWAALSVALFVTGCAHGSGSVCAGWQPIRPDKGETDRLSDNLARQIVAHNEYGVELGCWPGQ